MSDAQSQPRLLAARYDPCYCSHRPGHGSRDVRRHVLRSSSVQATEPGAVGHPRRKGSKQRELWKFTGFVIIQWDFIMI